MRHPNFTASAAEVAALPLVHFGVAERDRVQHGQCSGWSYARIRAENAALGYVSASLRDR
jgi:hypothetical protein